MKQYAGDNINFPAFWKYYNATVKKNYGDDYWRSFQNAFKKAMDEEGIWCGIHSNAVNMAWKKMTKLCTRATTIMKSNGGPGVACTSVTKNFKVWFKSYYNA